MINNRPRLLFAIHNLRTGGVQQALIALLESLVDQADIDLVVFAPGEQQIEIAGGVNVISAGGLSCLLGLAQSDLRGTPLLRLLRTLLVGLTRIRLDGLAIRLSLLGTRRLAGYDAAISFMHPAPPGTLHGGTAQYVLRRTTAARKTCFIHADVVGARIANDYNESVLARFDSIACVSESVARRVVSVMPKLASRVAVVRNCLQSSRFTDLPAVLDRHSREGVVQLVSVARLQAEKRLDLGLSALAECLSDGLDVRYRIVGDGLERKSLEASAIRLGVAHRVEFLGMQENPIQAVCDSDVLLLTSAHEASPLVFDEAYAVGTRVVTTRTLSAEERVGALGRGSVVDHTASSLAAGIRREAGVQEGRVYVVERVNETNREAIRTFWEAVLEGGRA